MNKIMMAEALSMAGKAFDLMAEALLNDGDEGTITQGVGQNEEVTLGNVRVDPPVLGSGPVDEFNTAPAWTIDGVITPWDGRIHTDSRTRMAKAPHQWKKKRSLDENILAAVEREIAIHPMGGLVAPVEQVTHVSNPGQQTAAPVGQAVPGQQMTAPVVLGTTKPGSGVTAPVTFEQCLQKLQALQPPIDWINAQYVTCGVNDLAGLAARPEACTMFHNLMVAYETQKANGQ